MGNGEVGTLAGLGRERLRSAVGERGSGGEAVRTVQRNEAGAQRRRRAAVGSPPLSLPARDCHLWRAHGFRSGTSAAERGTGLARTSRGAQENRALVTAKTEALAELTETAVSVAWPKFGWQYAPAVHRRGDVGRRPRAMRVQAHRDRLLAVKRGETPWGE